MKELEMQIMNIIVNAGDCKNHAYEALKKAKEKKYEEAEEEVIKLQNQGFKDVYVVPYPEDN